MIGVSESRTADIRANRQRRLRAIGSRDRMLLSFLGKGNA